MKIRIVLLCLMLVFFMACSSGSDDSSDGGSSAVAGTLDDDVAELGSAAQDTAGQIVASNSGVGFSPFSSAIASSSTNSGSSIPGILEDVVTNFTASQTLASSTGNFIQSLETSSSTKTVDGDCGGSMTLVSNTTYDDVDIYPYTTIFDYSFDNYCVTAGDYWIEYDGSGSGKYVLTSSGTGTYYYEFDITYTSNVLGYTSGSYEYAISCDIVDGETNCSTGVYEAGTTTYYTSDVSFSGDSESGYNVSYYMTDSDGNEYYVEFTDLTLCDDGAIGSGSGSISYNGDVISIEFTSCDEFVVTYNGYYETFSQ